MNHFLSPGLAAPNVLKVPVDYDIARELLPLARGARLDSGCVALRPPGESDIRWVMNVRPRARAEALFGDREARRRLKVTTLLPNSEHDHSQFPGERNP